MSSRASRLVVTFTVLQGPHPGQKFVASKDRMTIGRSPSNEIPIEHRQVSPRHASILWEHGQPVIRDLGSANGTTVNDRPLLGPRIIRDGDTIGLGDVLLKFQVSENAPASSVRSTATTARPAAGRKGPSKGAPASNSTGGNRWPVFVAAGCVLVIFLACTAAVALFFGVTQVQSLQAAPEVKILNPVSDTQVRAGQPIVIVASASDAKGVTRAELWVDGVLDATVTSSQSGGQRLLRIEQSWTSTASGPHDLSLKVYNAAGKSTESPAIPITVLEAAVSQPPTAIAAVPSPTPAPPPPSQPTPTPAPAAAPTSTPAAPQPAPQEQCTDDAAFVADVTVPDNTVFGSGDAIKKTWRIKNSGTCQWDANYRLAFVSGSKMEGPDAQPVAPTAAGGSTDITVAMRAPGKPGTFSGTWQMANARGERFGHTFTIVIQIPSPQTPTPAVPPTPTPLPGSAVNLTADRTQIKGGDCVTLKASAQGVSAAWLDSAPIVGGYMEKKVCPCAETTYNLKANMSSGEEVNKALTIKVDGGCSGKGPDLVVRDISVLGDTKPKVGASAKIEMRVKNQGVETANDFECSLTIIDLRTGEPPPKQKPLTAHVDQIEPDKDVTLSFTFKFPDWTTYTLQGRADNNGEEGNKGRVTEGDESNNLKEVQFKPNR